MGFLLFCFGVFWNLCDISFNTQGIEVERIYGIPGTKGKIDGSALTATFNCPASVLVSDKVYIADEQNHLIRTITVNK